MAKKVSDRMDAKGTRLVSFSQENGGNFALALTYELGQQSPILRLFGRENYELQKASNRLFDALLYLAEQSDFEAVRKAMKESGAVPSKNRK
jgi:hypothetical protein